MAGKAVGDLSIKVSADTGPLAQDLQRAGRELDAFNQKAARAEQRAAAAERAASAPPRQRTFTPGRDEARAAAAPIAPRGSAARAFAPIIPRGATGAARMAVGAPRDRAADPLYAGFAAQKATAGMAADRERLEQERAASAKREVMDRQLARLAGGDSRAQMKRRREESGVADLAGQRTYRLGQPVPFASGRAVDQAFDAAGQAAAKIGKTFTAGGERISAAVSRAAERVGGAGQATGTFARRVLGDRLTEGAGAAGRFFGGAIGAGASSTSGMAAGGFAKVRDTAAAASSSLREFARDAASVASGLVVAELGLGSLSAGYQHLTDSIKKAADHERQLVGFEVLLRSAEDAKTLLADVRQFAAQTPFNNRELADASRQLLAYGFSAEQIMPTLKMLGDVSAAMPDRLPIGDAAYLFGTLRTQGRAFTRDINQFSNRGVSINEELAAVVGKPLHEIPALVEEGRIGFEDVRKAFIRMTSEGGRFAGMTARQGATAAAAYEQLVDAIDQAKIAFGSALIEELDLRGAARDLGAFAGRMRDATSDARPLLRQVGLIGRGAANVGWEFAKAGVEIARIGFDSIDAAFPKLREVRAEVGRLVADASEFRLDERQVVRAGFAIGGALVEAGAETTRQVGLFGEGMTYLFEWVAKSAREARDFMKETAAWMGRINDSVVQPMKFINPGTIITELGGDLVRRREDELRGRRPGDPINRYQLAPPIPGIAADRVREEWPAFATAVAQLSQQVERERREVAAGRLRPGFLQQTEQLLAGILARQDAYSDAFVGERAVVRRRLDTGDIPPIREAAPSAPAASPDSFSQVERQMGWLRDTVFTHMKKFDAGAFRQEWDARLAGRLAEIDRREAFAAMEGERRAAFAGAIGPAAAVPSAQPDARALATAQNRYAAWAGVVGPMALAGVPDRTDPPRPEQMTLGVELRKQFDPRQELDQYRRDLDAVRLHRLAGPDSEQIANRAWDRKVREVAERFGVGQQPQLPAAVEVGSADDARLINLWRSQGQTQTTDQLLMQLVNLVQRGLNTIEKVPVAPPPRAVTVFPF